MASRSQPANLLGCGTWIDWFDFDVRTPFSIGWSTNIDRKPPFADAGGCGIGISKSGLSGVSMVHVIVFAFVFGALPSTGSCSPC